MRPESDGFLPAVARTYRPCAFSPGPTTDMNFVIAVCQAASVGYRVGKTPAGAQAETSARTLSMKVPS